MDKNDEILLRNLRELENEINRIKDTIVGYGVKETKVKDNFVYNELRKRPN